MSKWQAIVFDLDDTLYSESRYVLSGFRAVADWLCPQLGLDCQTGYSQLEALFNVGVRGNTFNRWLADCGISPDEWIRPLVEIYRNHTPQLAPFAEIPDLLPQLGERAPLGLITDGYLNVQQKKWHALNLGDHFAAVIFSDQLGREHWKPSPKPYLAVQETLSIEPSRAVYIADNPKKDFLGAKRAGWHSIWFRHIEGEYTHLEPETPDHSPDRTITTLTGLLETLDELEQTL